MLNDKVKKYADISKIGVKNLRKQLPENSENNFRKIQRTTFSKKKLKTLAIFPNIFFHEAVHPRKVKNVLRSYLRKY